MVGKQVEAAKRQYWSVAAILAVAAAALLVVYAAVKVTALPGSGEGDAKGLQAAEPPVSGFAGAASLPTKKKPGPDEVDWEAAKAASTSAGLAISPDAARAMSLQAGVPVVTMASGVASPTKEGDLYIRTHDGYSSQFDSSNYSIVISALKPPFDERPVGTPTPSLTAPPNPSIDSYTIGRTEAGMSAAFSRFHVAYSVTIICNGLAVDISKPTCVNEAEVNELINNLVVVTPR